MSEEFDEDQFDGFVSSNAKSKYACFNDIQNEQPEQILSNHISNHVSYLNNHNNLAQSNFTPQNITSLYQQNHIIANVNPEIKDINNQTHQLQFQSINELPPQITNSNDGIPMNYSDTSLFTAYTPPNYMGREEQPSLSTVPTHQQQKEKHEEEFEFGEYVEIHPHPKIITNNHEAAQSLVQEQKKLQQEFFAPPLQSMLISAQENGQQTPDEALIREEQKQQCLDIFDFDLQQNNNVSLNIETKIVPQKKEQAHPLSANLISLYDAFPQHEQAENISPMLEINQTAKSEKVIQADKKIETQHLFDIYAKSNNPLQGNQIKLEEQQFPIQENTETIPSYVQQQPLDISPQENKDSNLQNLKNNLFEFDKQEIAAITGQQYLEILSPQPSQEQQWNQNNAQSLQILTQNHASETDSNLLNQFQFEQQISQQDQIALNHPQIQENIMQLDKYEQNKDEDEFDDFVEGEQIELEQPLNGNEQFQVAHQITSNHNQEVYFHQPEQQLTKSNNLTLLQDIKFDTIGPQKQFPINKRAWRNQIEDIVGLDADCMDQYIAELEELKLDVYKSKVIEYAQLAKDIQTLRKKKQIHVDNEEYEEATVIRDTLRAKEPIAMQLKKKILEVAAVMDLMDGQDMDYHIQRYIYEHTQETIQNPSVDLLLPKIWADEEFVGKLKKELKKSESVLSIIKLQGQLEKVRYEKKYQNFILGLRKIIGMSYRFQQLNECITAVNDRLSELKLEKEVYKVDYEYIFENTMTPYLKGQQQQQYYCNYCFLAKKNLIEYKGKLYDVCCLNFYYNIN